MNHYLKIQMIILSTMILFSCNTKVSKDPMVLLAELNHSGEPNQITSAETGKGWALLFDGTSTAGWHGYNMDEFPQCWAVEDGTLTALSTGGAEELDIVTDRTYRNFALSIEFKLDTGTNSGIIFQVCEDPKYKYPYETGPEFQVIDQDNWSGQLEDWQICGANYAMYPPLELATKPVGQWNHALLVVDGNQVTQILNGVVVVKYEKYSDDWTKRRNSGKWNDFPDYGKYDEGHIDLQNHGTKVWYRNIKIKTF